MAQTNPRLLRTRKPADQPSSRSRLHRLIGNPTRTGAVMVVTLLATLLLAGLVFYVFNLGRQTQARLLAQHSADAAVTAGTGWVARTMNTVAMNNVAMVRMIALVQILDSLPQVTDHVLHDQRSLAEALNRQLLMGAGASHVRDALEQVQDEVRNELAVLEPLDQLFNGTGQAAGYDVGLMTAYNGPAGRGQLWQALESLDEINQTAVENMGVLAQVNALRGGQANFELHRRQGGVVLLPLIADLPTRRGHFDDFERPLRHGLLPVDTDDTTTNRGPYDAVFGQRDRYPTSRRREIDGRGTVGIGQPAGDREVTQPAEGYRVVGPFTQLLRHFSGVHQTQMRHSQFSRRLDDHAVTKLNYLWPTGSSRQVFGADWILDYQQARDIAANERSRIQQTRFVIVEIKSRYPSDHPSFLSEGSWTHVTFRGVRSPRTIHSSRWLDPESWDIPKVNNDIWLDAWYYTAGSDASIGITPQFDPQGVLIQQPVYRYDHFIFAGINVAESYTVSNPNNVPSHDLLPAPIDFIHDQIRHDDPDAQQRYLRFMAVTHLSDRAALWPKRFSSGKPAPYVAAMAQAYIFNDHSWDLWTQMWQMQLEQISVEDYEHWLRHMQLYRDDADLVPTLSASDVDSLYDYLRSIEPLAQVMLSE